MATGVHCFTVTVSTFNKYALLLFPIKPTNKESSAPASLPRQVGVTDTQGRMHQAGN